MVDYMISLFDSTATSFATDSIGQLTDAISCIVKEVLNGEYTLDMEYPITGRHYDELQLRQIIMSPYKPSLQPYGPQSEPRPGLKRHPFRIASISRPINGIVTVRAEHISYDLIGYPVNAFYNADSAESVFSKISQNSTIANPFTYYSMGVPSPAFAILHNFTPISIRSILMGSSNSVLSLFPGEYQYGETNLFEIYYYPNRGTDNGVTIEYGKNLIDLQQEENCNSVYTGIYPFWYSEEEGPSTGLVTLTPKIMNAAGTYDFTRILVVDFSSEIDHHPTALELQTAGQAYLDKNNIGIPKISIRASFVLLTQVVEYQNITDIKAAVNLGDTVTVKFPRLGVDAKARCIETTFNVLTDKYEEIKLGDAVPKITSTILSLKKKVNKL